MDTWCVRIRFPLLPIDHERIVMHALRKRHRDGPDARSHLVQLVSWLPIGKAACELNVHGLSLKAELNQDARRSVGARPLAPSRTQVRRRQKEDDCQASTGRQ